MPNLFGELNDQEVLERAVTILAARQEQRDEEKKRLFRKYARHRGKEPHDLGKPKTLLPEETLLLFALERNKYVVHAYQGETRWHGEATCRHHARGTVLSMGSSTRLELLWALWASVSDQTGDTVTLEEHHLRGSIVQRDIRQLQKELREQEQHGTDDHSNED